MITGKAMAGIFTHETRALISYQYGADNMLNAGQKEKRVLRDAGL